MILQIKEHSSYKLKVHNNVSKQSPYPYWPLSFERVYQVLVLRACGHFCPIGSDDPSNSLTWETRMSLVCLHGIGNDLKTNGRVQQIRPDQYYICWISAVIKSRLESCYSYQNWIYYYCNYCIIDFKYVNRIALQNLKLCIIEDHATI